MTHFTEQLLLWAQAPFCAGRLRMRAEGRHEDDRGIVSCPRIGVIDRSSAPGAGLDALTDEQACRRRDALALGEAPGGDGRFRESDFYISPVR